MPAHFKKRRGPQGPNKNERKVLRARDAEDRARSGGAIGARFPGVKLMKIQLTFLDARQHVLDEKSLALTPADAATFTVPCPGQCGTGSFDFEGKVADAVGARLPTADGGAKCAETLYAGSADTCGCEVRCRMQFEYLPID